jgi:outer membrane lipoprotein-sorting protein
MPLLAILILLAGSKAPSAEQILRRAEDVRNPSLDYAVDFTIHGVSRGEKAAERDASYSMIASGKDRTVILMKSPAELFGALVLMAEDRYWMLLPRATRPWELSAAQMLAGDIATGDLARSNLARGYRVSVAGEDVTDGEPCWRLELQAETDREHYARIVYWVAKAGFRPKKLEHYGRSGKLAKVVEYGDYRKGALGVRSMTLRIESLDEWKEGSTLSFANLRKIDPAPVSFTAEGMIPFRDAAFVAEGSGDASGVTMDRILRAMTAARR